MRSSILELSKRDFRKQYAGTYLGIVWTFLQPLLLISVLYTVFTYGFRVAPAVDGIPFSVYLITGMVSWMFFSENLNGMSRCIMEHTFLAKRSDFRLSTLPLVKLLSSSVAHVFLVSVALGVTLFNDVVAGIYLFQLLYYWVAMSFLLLGIGWMTSSAIVFVSDTGKLITVLTQFGFWLTPIFWTLENVPVQYRWIPQLNPMCYIITGYRDSFVGQSWFWQKPIESAYFWVFAMTTFLVGLQLFRRLRPQFAEVL